MKTIKSISKTSAGYHPAFGFTYDIVFTDGSKLQVLDEDLMAQFEECRTFDEDKRFDVQTLVGKEFEIEN